MAEERIGSRRPTRLSTAGNSMLSARISARFSRSSVTPFALVRPGMDLYVSGLSALALAGIVFSHAYATTKGMILEGFFDQIHVYVRFLHTDGFGRIFPVHIKPPS